MRSGALTVHPGPIWMRLGGYFYLIASILTVISLATNLSALITPDRILDAFHIRHDNLSIWEFYIRLRSLFALSLISIFGICLLINHWVRPMTYAVILYLLIYLLIDVVTVILFGEISAQVFILLSARLFVATLLMAAMNQYVTLINQRL